MPRANNWEIKGCQQPTAHILEREADREWQPYNPTDEQLRGLKLKQRKVADPPLEYWEIKGVNPWQSWRLWWRETQIVWELFIWWLLLMLVWLSALAVLIYLLIASISGAMRG